MLLLVSVMVNGRIWFGRTTSLTCKAACGLLQQRMQAPQRLARDGADLYSLLYLDQLKRLCTGGFDPGRPRLNHA